MRRVFAILVWCALLGSGLAYGAEKSYVWKLSTIRPEGTAVDQDVKIFVEKVLKDTGGRIKIDLYPNSQLGDYTIVQERISVGSVEMAVQPVGTTSDRQMQLLNMPYLVKDWEGVRNNYLSDTPFMNWASERFARQDIQLLATWPVYFGGVATVKEPPNPGDPSVPKGLKCRVITQKSFELLAESQGYQATPLPLAETFTALQTGIVDGVFGAGAEGYYSNFRDVIKFYIPANTHFEQWYVLINKELWDSLSDNDRKILSEAAREMEARRISVAENDTRLNEQKLTDYGIRVLPLTPQELTVLAETSRKAIFPEIRKAVGEAEFDAAIKNIVE